MIEASATQSFIDSAPRHPAASAFFSPGLPGLRFHTLTEKPALLRFAAMEAPMIPMPKNASDTPESAVI